MRGEGVQVAGSNLEVGIGGTSSLSSPMPEPAPQPTTTHQDSDYIAVPSFNITTDSPNVMRLLRELSLDSGHFGFAYGCFPHAFHNLAMDLCKLEPIGAAIKTCVALVTAVHQPHLLRSAYDSMSLARFGKRLSLILFTKSRWGTLYYMLQRLVRESFVLRDLTSVQPMDSPFAELNVPEAISDTVDSKSFWVGVRALEKLFKTLSSRRRNAQTAWINVFHF